MGVASPRARPGYLWSAWEELAHKSPTAWKRFVRRAVQRNTTFRVCESRVKQAHADILKQITAIGGTITGYEFHTQHYCLLCDKPFQNKRAWFLHSYHRHSYVSMAGQAAQGTSCPVCAKEYFCQEKLKHHLQYSAVCRNFAWHSGGSRQEHGNAVHALMPWVYLGHDAVQHDDSTNRDEAQLCQDLDETLRHFSVSVDSAAFEDDLCARLRETCNRPMPFPDVVRTFEKWLDAFGAEADPT